MPNPTLLITGANGFVGRALCQFASERAFKVKAATRSPQIFTDGIENVLLPSLDREHLNKSHTRTSLVKSLAGVDVLIHLAARVHVMKESATDSLAAYRETNLAGTLALAQIAIEAGVKRFVYLSSIKVNGESTPLGQPFAAGDEPVPEDPYGVSKLEAERSLKALCQSATMELVIIRPPLVYGPGVGANFASMMRMLRLRVPLPLGAINNSRSMVALDNLTDLILLCASHPAASGQTFLVSDDEDVSVTALLRKLIALMRVRTQLIPIPASFLAYGAKALGKTAVARRLCDSLQVDIEKTKQVLGWVPPLTLDQGLKKTVDWYLHK